MRSDQFVQSLAAVVFARKRPGRPVIVGINGIDGSGKSTLATALASSLEEADHPVCRISIDGFHNPRRHRYQRDAESPEGYYRDSFDYQAFADCALKPAFEARSRPVSCQTKLLDLESDVEDVRRVDVGPDHFVVAEGVFLFRPEILPLLHLKIFVDAAFETILQRVTERDLGRFGSVERILDLYRKKYIPGQSLYLAEVDPMSLADIVIDNNDLDDPKIVRGGVR